MKRSWRRPKKSRDDVPVEMRFVDMFMAAVGSLVFMAMLLSVLARQLPSPSHSPTATVKVNVTETVTALHVVTRTLPHARVGEPFQLTFAYRGGSGPVTWDVVSAAKTFPPAGMQFDQEEGSLSGTPSTALTIPFAIRAIDAKGPSDLVSLELIIEPELTSSRWIQLTFAIVLLVLVLFILLAAIDTVVQTRLLVARLTEASAKGTKRYAWKEGKHSEKIVNLPEGIEEYRDRERNAAFAVRVVAIVFVIFIAGFLWFLIWG